MVLIQLTGLSGAGKSTLSQHAKQLLEQQCIAVEIVDGDVYRQTLCKDLGFSREDRMENIRRLGAVAHGFAQQGKVAIVAAISPFEAVRQELAATYGAKTVWIRCDLDTLTHRDTKGLYRRAFLPDGHPEKLANLTGVNDVYEPPVGADLIIDTNNESSEVSVTKFCNFIMSNFQHKKLP